MTSERDPKTARAALATEFVTAVARRDDAALGTFFKERELCALLAAEFPDRVPDGEQACVEKWTRVREGAMIVYRQAVSETFVAGDTAEAVVDADHGIYQVEVRSRGGDASVVVAILEHDGRRFVIFPRKV